VLRAGFGMKPLRSLQMDTLRRDYFHRFVAVIATPDQDAARGRSAQGCAHMEAAIDALMAALCLPIMDGLVTQTFEVSCRFHRADKFPSTIQAGVHLVEAGEYALRFEVGLFGEHRDQALATGQVVRVFTVCTESHPDGQMMPLPKGLYEGLHEALKSSL
jgi:acyl-CoA thioesterase FadM